MDTPTRRLLASTRVFFLPIAAITMIAIVGANTVARAQQPPSPPKSPQPPANSKPQTKKKVVVRGCMSTSTVTHAEGLGYTSSVPETLRTTGSRSVRALLKEFNGHTVELTGTLSGLGNQAMGGGKVKDTGKTKIHVGTSERHVGGNAPDRTIDEQPIEVPTLDVSSVKDIAPHCHRAP